MWQLPVQKSTLVLSSYLMDNRKREISRFLEELLYEHSDTIKFLSPKSDTIIETDPISRELKENEIVTFDAGEIVDFTKCPYFYRMRHVWNYSAPLAEELGYGNALHYCLRRAVELHKQGVKPVKAIIRAVREDFHMPYAPKPTLNILKRSAENVLLNYTVGHLDDMESVAEVEYRLEFPHKNATIAGKVDVIINKGDIVEVREYKTSKKVAKFPQVSLQVRLYALGLKGLGYNVGKGSVAYLQDGEIKDIEVDENALSDARKLTEGILDRIQNQEYTPTPGEFCEVCDYRQICKWAKR